MNGVWMGSGAGTGMVSPDGGVLMSTNPIVPVPPVVPEPDRNPDEDTPDVGIRPPDDSPLTEPAPDPDEDPNEQLPRDS
jgi:hypothetical protein